MNYPGLTEVLSNHAQQSSDLASSLLEEFLFHLSVTSPNVHETWMMEKFQQFNAEVLSSMDQERLSLAKKIVREIHSGYSAVVEGYR